MVNFEDGFWLVFRGQGLNAQVQDTLQEWRHLSLGHIGLGQGLFFIYWNEFSGSGYFKGLETLVIGALRNRSGECFSFTGVTSRNVGE